jgi:hypothetical protein
VNLAVRKGLFNALTGSSSLKALVGDRIYFEQAPGGAALPYVIFSKVPSGAKIRSLKKGATIKRDIWLVKGVDRNSSANVADEIADAIDALLDEETFVVSGHTVLDVHLYSDVSYPEPDGDQLYRHSGGNYACVLI